jgi:hypothetical protein
VSRDDGATSGGVPVAEGLVAALADEAAAGYDVATLERCGRLGRPGRCDSKRGRPRPQNDMLIAASCRSHGLPLATLKVEDYTDFAEFHGLELNHWLTGHAPLVPKQCRRTARPGLPARGAPGSISRRGQRLAGTGPC